MKALTESGIIYYINQQIDNIYEDVLEIGSGSFDLSIGHCLLISSLNQVKI